MLTVHKVVGQVVPACVSAVNGKQTKFVGQMDVRSEGVSDSLAKSLSGSIKLK